MATERPAVLPRPDGASGAARLHLPAAGPRPRRRGAAHALPGGPRRSSPSSRRLAAPAAGATIARAVGAALAAASRRRAFPLTRANALSVAGWRPLFEQAAAARRRGAARPARRIEHGTRPSGERDWPRELPQGVIHADLFPDNVFFLGEQAVRPDRLLFRLQRFRSPTTSAICLNAWCFEPDHSFNVTKARALLTRLRRACGRCRPPSGTALPLLARGSALRFLLTRLFDWLNVPPGALVQPKDPLEYVRKLRFHSASPASRDYGLAHRDAGVSDKPRRRSSSPTAPAPGNPGPGGWGAILIFGERREGADGRRGRTPPTTAWS